MKKLLATMLLSLGITATAQAQSSVTIYGLLDVGYSGKNIKGSPSTATNTQTTNAFGQSYQLPSRLGFRGTEDLGGGTSAFFTIETGLQPVGSAISALNNRQTFVGLAQKGLGQAAIGYQYTPVHLAVATTDPGQVNGVIGSVIFPMSGTDGGQQTVDVAYTPRLGNALTMATERVKGFKANAIYSLNNRDATQTSATTGGTTNSSAWGLGVDYVYKDLLATVAYQSIKNLSTGATPSISTASAGAIGGTGITYTPAYTVTNGTDTQMYAGLVYDLKIVKAYLGYVDRKVTSALNPDAQLNRSAQQIGVRGFFNPKVEGWASVGNGRYSAFGANTATANFTGYQVGSNYWLSKRTNLYVIAGSTQTSSTSTTGALSGNQYAAGMRHTF